MATRWEITKAVRASGLPAPSRLVMLVLADVAEVGTAEIPQQHTPSLKVLAGETGLDESTVKRHLASLEAAGWLERLRPSLEDARLRSVRTRYRLSLPKGGAQEAPPQGAECTPQGAEEALPGRTVRPIKEEVRSSSDLNPSSSEKPTKTPKPEPHRPDVEKVCEHLADRIAGNGSKRPTITDGWRTAARLLIDRDGRTVDQVLNAIDWCQNDDFWRTVILSMPKLRTRYDQLRLAAQRVGARASPASTAPTVIPTADRCPQHADQRAGRCRHCRARAIAKGGSP